MTRVFIYPYKDASGSAKALAQAMGVRRIRRENSRYHPRGGDVVINWGSGDVFGSGWVTFYNDYGAVTVAKNKLDTFNQFESSNYESTEEGVDPIDGPIHYPPFTTSPQEAAEWASANRLVVGREILRGHSGAGIRLLRTPEEVMATNLPLYTKYIPKKYEYRVHCTRLGVFDIVKKAKRNDGTEADQHIRSHDKGWVFIRDFAHTPNPQVGEQAMLALNALGLDFGAVDVIWNEREGRAYVLEVNTAPGLEGETVNKYAEALSNLLTN